MARSMATEHDMGISCVERTVNHPETALQTWQRTEGKRDWRWDRDLGLDTRALLNSALPQQLSRHQGGGGGAGGPRWPGVCCCDCYFPCYILALNRRR